MFDYLIYDAPVYSHLDFGILGPKFPKFDLGLDLDAHSIAPMLSSAVSKVSVVFIHRYQLVT